jgi:hypothetical protein
MRIGKSMKTRALGVLGLLVLVGCVGGSKGLSNED